MHSLDLNENLNLAHKHVKIFYRIIWSFVIHIHKDNFIQKWRGKGGVDTKKFTPPLSLVFQITGTLPPPHAKVLLVN